jgi:prefoldin subunit 5
MLDHIQAEIETQREDIDRLDNAGYKIVAAIDSTVGRIEREVHGFRDALQKAQRDIEALLDMKGELQKFKTEVDEIKFGSWSSGSAVKDQAKEIESLKAEVAELKRERGFERAQKVGPAPQVTAHFPSRELDILTTSISKIGNRASQIESLQMEFEMLKGRVERMEGKGPEQRHAPTYPSDGASDSLTGEFHRKRPLGDAASTADTESSKRVAFASEPPGRQSHMRAAGNEKPGTSLPSVEPQVKKHDNLRSSIRVTVAEQKRSGRRSGRQSG